MNLDQAQNLRLLADASARKRLGSRRAQVRVITSGKGGVGKSTLTLNLGIALAAAGKRVLLVDADMNLANLHILMGLSPDASLKDVALERKTVPEIILRGPGDVDLLPAPSGALALVGLERSTREILLQQLTILERIYDVMLIDTTAGIADQVLDFVVSADDVVVVVTPEPTSIIDAYALIKVATARRDDVRFHVVVNQVRSEQSAKVTFQKIQIAAEQFLGKTLLPAGYVKYDPKVTHAVQAQVPLLIQSANSEAAHCMRNVADLIIRTAPALEMPHMDRPGFFSRFARIARDFVEDAPQG